MVDDAKREYRVAEHQEGYVVQSRIVGSHWWRDGPIFLSEEKAVEAMHRLEDRTKMSMVTTTTLSRWSLSGVGRNTGWRLPKQPALRQFIVTGQETETQPCQ